MNYTLYILKSVMAWGCSDSMTLECEIYDPLNAR